MRDRLDDRRVGDVAFILFKLPRHEIAVRLGHRLVNLLHEGCFPNAGIPRD